MNLLFLIHKIRIHALWLHGMATRGRVAGEGRRVVVQSDGWNRFVAGRATCSVDDQVGDATCGQSAERTNKKTLTTIL